MSETVVAVWLRLESIMQCVTLSLTSLINKLQSMFTWSCQRQLVTSFESITPCVTLSLISLEQQVVAVVYLVVADTACSCVTMSWVSESITTCVTLSLIWLYLAHNVYKHINLSAIIEMLYYYNDYFSFSSLHTMRKHDSLEKDIITGTLPGDWARGRPKTSWMNNITAWTGMTLNGILRKTDERSEWRAVIWRVENWKKKKKTLVLICFVNDVLYTLILVPGSLVIHLNLPEADWQRKVF